MIYLAKITTFRLFLFLAATAGFMLSSCNRKGGAEDTATSGSIKISVDESLQPIMESQVDTFEKLYKYADINATYTSEGQAVQDLLQDSVRLIVLSRPLTEPEYQELARQNLSRQAIKVTKVAIDGIAIILNKANPDTAFTISQLKDIFSGKATTWKQVSGKASGLGDITIVFDNNNSSTARFMKDSLMGTASFPPNTFASKSNPALIDYVEQHENAVGVLGVNWISDADDSTAVSFMNKVRIAAVKDDRPEKVTQDYLQPFQAYLAEQKEQPQYQYALRRYWYVISREARAGLGTGFASFVAGDKGQRIFLKSGLVPATMPIRIVGFRE